MRNNKGQFVKGHHWREQKPWWDKEWLYDQYASLGKSAGDIAKEWGVTDAAILFWLRKHEIKRRTVSEARAIKHWGAVGADNPMWNKLGELNPMWKGGVTPERQSFYASQEWRNACSSVWKRDNATCQRCKLIKENAQDMPFHIHHIKTFADKELRSDISNLILLCESCHHFVHSKENVNHDYIS